MSRNTTFSQTKPLFAGHDAGHYDLPASLLAHRSGLGVLRDALRKAQEDEARFNPADIRQRLADELGESARAGALPAGWVERWFAVAGEQSRAAAEASILSDAIAEAENDLVNAVRETADVVIVTCLRPVLGGVLATVRDRAAKTPNVPWDQPRLLARESPAVRETFRMVEDANERYGALRHAQHALRLVTGSPSEEAWELHELRNMPEVWPGRVFTGPKVPPWPENPLARLVWLASQPGIWLPTGRECNDEYAAWQSGRARLQNRDALFGVYPGPA